MMMKKIKGTPSKKENLREKETTTMKTCIKISTLIINKLTRRIKRRKTCDRILMKKKMLLKSKRKNRVTMLLIKSKRKRETPTKINKKSKKMTTGGMRTKFEEEKLIKEEKKMKIKPMKKTQQFQLKRSVR